MKKILTGLLICFSVAVVAQTTDSSYKAVDDYVNKIGKLDTMNLGTITYLITKKFPEPKDKVRAIFNWITNNISFDCKAARNVDNTKTSSDLVLKTRKTNAGGYAALFQDMCSVVKIRCLTVDGYLKNNVEQIDEKPDELNHTWAVVQLGQSPETWHYIDPALGSGYTDEKIATFIKSYNDDYFFADKKIFNYQHFADNSAWQIGPGPKSLKEFIGLPLVQNASYEYGINNFIPASGKIKTKSSKPVQFSFKINPDIKIEIVSLEIGETKKKKRKTVDYTESNGAVNFSYKFEEDDTIPVTILINNKPVLGYRVEVTE